MPIQSNVENNCTSKTANELENSLVKKENVKLTIKKYSNGHLEAKTNEPKICDSKKVSQSKNKIEEFAAIRKKSKDMCLRLDFSPELEYLEEKKKFLESEIESLQVKGN